MVKWDVFTFLGRIEIIIIDKSNSAKCWYRVSDVIPFKEEFGFYRDDVVSTISEFVFRAYAFQLDFVYVEVFMLRKLIVYVIVHNRSLFWD